MCHLQVDEVKNIMSENIEKVLSRGEKLDLLVDKTDNLMFEVGGGSHGLTSGQCQPASQPSQVATGVKWKSSQPSGQPVSPLIDHLHCVPAR